MLTNELPKHNMKDYLVLKLEKKNWEAKDLSVKSGVRESDISKLKTGVTKKLNAEIFFRLYTALGDKCKAAIRIVYPTLNLTMGNYKEAQRSDFGRFMKSFEKNENSIKEIAAKTGIKENRLKTLYFRIGAVEAYELLLIEAAVGKKPGDLFEAFFGGVEVGN